MTDEEMQGPEVGKGPSKVISKVGIIGLLALLAFLLFMISAYLPGYIAYRRRSCVHQAVSTAEGIRTALEAYAKNHAGHRYPENIPDYAALRALVNNHGGSLPGEQSDVHIARLYYILDYGGDYNLTIEVDVSNPTEDHGFLLVTPEGVTRHSKVMTSDVGFKAEEIARDRRYAIHENRMVVDTETGLMWANKDNGQNTSWDYAQRYCEDYTGGGYDDWRMPSIVELTGIYDESKENRYGYHVSPLICISGPSLWSSDKRGPQAALFDFRGGYEHWKGRGFADAGRVLPVRGGK